MQENPIFSIPPDLNRHPELAAPMAGTVSWELRPETVTDRFRELSFGGLGLKISVNDTGADLDHPVFKQFGGINVGGTKDFTGSRRGSYDVDGHGTFVLAQWFRLLPRATYYVAKVLGDNGFGSATNIVRGNEWAAAQGVDAQNESLGSPQAFPRKGEWLRTWSGILFAASGNDGKRGILWPANNGVESGVIPCGSFSQGQTRSKFSNYGARLLCLGAGSLITGPKAGTQGDVIFSGTSMGTPDAGASHMGYVAATRAAGHADISAPEAIEKLTEGIATDIDAPGRDQKTGFGIVTRSVVIQQMEKLEADSPL